MIHARIPSPNRSGLSSSLGAFWLLGLGKHLSKDLQACLSLAGGGRDGKRPIRMVCINSDLWQPHVADVFPGRQYKGGASFDVEPFPALLRLLEDLVFRHTPVEVVGKALLIEAHLLGEFEENVAQRDAAALREEGHAQRPIKLIGQGQALSFRTLDRLEGRPYRHRPLAV